MKIYTKTGDKGTTSLFDGTRVAKNHIRVDTYGTIDELNSLLGVVVTFLSSKKGKEPKIKEEVQVIQKDLLDIGSRLANPKEKLEQPFIVYLTQRISQFEKDIDAMTNVLPELTHFVIPGGSYAGSFFHVTRTVTRKVERKIIHLSRVETVDGIFITYFNRLSDLLFTYSRFVNFLGKEKEIIWTKYIG